MKNRPPANPLTNALTKIRARPSTGVLGSVLDSVLASMLASVLALSPSVAIATDSTVTPAPIAVAPPPPAKPCVSELGSPAAYDAFATGLLGVQYGYPLVDLLAQMHNETHVLVGGQKVFAPVNAYYRFEQLLTPATQGNLRAPNADTLYLSAWLDLRRGPVVLHVPDTADRYYTLALMDLYGLPVHLGRRTTGTREGRFAVTPPGWQGTLPADVKPFPVATDRVWVLGRLLVSGDTDLPAARQLLARFSIETLDGQPAAPMPAVAAPASTRRPAQSSQVDATPVAPLRPHGKPEFFAVLNEALRSLPVPLAEAALLSQFDRLGFGPASTFDFERLPAAAREGLSCAAAVGGAVISATGFRATSNHQGWMLAANIAQPGFDFPLRAAVARGGYINDPAEALYPAAATDQDGIRLDGSQRYRLRFAPGQLPPVDAFWSVTPYESTGFQLVENPIARYAIGDRTPGLRLEPDGSLEILLAATAPPDPGTNWLPVPAGPFHLVARLYQPRPAALNGTWKMPVVERLP